VYELQLRPEFFPPCESFLASRVHHADHLFPVAILSSLSDRVSLPALLVTDARVGQNNVLPSYEANTNCSVPFVGFAEEG